MKPISILLMFTMALAVRAGDVAGHHTESLRDVVQRFLNQFEGNQGAEAGKAKALLLENGIKIWDPEKRIDGKMVGDESYSIDGWRFNFWQKNLTGITYSRSLEKGLDRNSMIVITIRVKNEEVCYHDSLLTQGDVLNSGVYFIEDWSIAVTDRTGARSFFVDRGGYWKMRQTQRINLGPAGTLKGTGKGELKGTGKE